jgi:SAM-dependent methyltransferase
VLEVGCSASPYLRALWRSHAIRGYGLDLDLEALALGCRLAEREKMDLSFCRASAHDLPYGDAAFDFVICRNALTYMAQRTAVGEMMRVVKPGGFIYLRFENIWYDLLHTTHPHGWRQLCCRLRDFGFGLVNAASGWQPVPGAAGCSIGRSFATVGRLTKLLCRGGGQLVEVRPSLKCPTFLGRSTQTSLLARRAAR